MQKTLATLAALAFTPSPSPSPSFRFVEGSTRKVYAEDIEKMGANKLSAQDRAAHNSEVLRKKREQHHASLASFVPRKASHKRGHLVA